MDEKSLLRFESKTRRTDTCWLWTGTLLDKGYGQFYLAGKKVRAHRVAYQHYRGEIPEGMQVEHRCRVRHCVNPDHLRLATNAQNMENIGVYASSTSGIRGVNWLPNAGKWRAMVRHLGRPYYLGLFEDINDAEAAVVAKRLELHTFNELDRAW